MTTVERRLLLPFLHRVRGGAVRTLAVEAAGLLARFAKARRPVPQRKIEKAEKRLAKKGARSAVRLAVEVRAKGSCEACELASLHPLEMDHFYGRARSESVETCWMLCRGCHREKTENLPSRRHWDVEFRIHCRWHGYDFKPRLIHDFGRRGGTAIPPAAKESAAADLPLESK